MQNQKKTLFVSCGIRPFPNLLKQIDKVDVYECLVKNNFKKVIFQIGNEPSYQPRKYFKFSKKLTVLNCTSIINEEEYLTESDLIISSLSISVLLSSLEYKPNMIAVTEQESGFHQNLSRQLQNSNFCQVHKCDDINSQMLNDYINKCSLQLEQQGEKLQRFKLNLNFLNYALNPEKLHQVIANNQITQEQMETEISEKQLKPVELPENQYIKDKAQQLVQKEQEKVSREQFIQKQLESEERKKVNKRFNADLKQQIFPCETEKRTGYISDGSNCSEFDEQSDLQSEDEDILLEIPEEDSFDNSLYKPNPGLVMYDQNVQQDQMFFENCFSEFKQIDFQNYEEHKNYNSLIKQAKRFYSLNYANKDVYEILLHNYPPEKFQQALVRKLEKDKIDHNNIKQIERLEIVKLIQDVYKKKIIEQQYLVCDCNYCKKLTLPFLLRYDFTIQPTKLQQELRDKLGISDQQHDTVLHNVMFQNYTLYELCVTSTLNN